MSTETVITPPSQVAAPPEPRRMAHGTRHRVQSRVFRIGRWVVIIGFLIATLVPFYYMLLAVGEADRVVVAGSRLLVGQSFGVHSADLRGRAVLTGVRRPRLRPLSWPTAPSWPRSVALALLIGIPGAYAIARLPFFGRRQISGVFLAAYLFPAILMAIPLFVGFTRIGLRGILVGLVIVYIAQTVPVAIYMLRNYFETVPESLEEAGLVDGLTPDGVLRRSA